MRITVDIDDTHPSFGAVLQAVTATLHSVAPPVAPEATPKRIRQPKADAAAATLAAAAEARLFPMLKAPAPAEDEPAPAVEDEPAPMDFDTAQELVAADNEIAATPLPIPTRDDMLKEIRDGLSARSNNGAVDWMKANIHAPFGIFSLSGLSNTQMAEVLPKLRAWLAS